MRRDNDLSLEAACREGPPRLSGARSRATWVRLGAVYMAVQRGSENLSSTTAASGTSNSGIGQKTRQQTPNFQARFSCGLALETPSVATTNSVTVRRA